MSAPTVRDRVHTIQVELRERDVVPSRARELVLELAGLLGNINMELMDAELAYNKRLLACMATHEAANRAKVEAETSDEYVRYRLVKETQKLVVLMRSSLNTVIRSHEAELKALA